MISASSTTTGSTASSASDAIHHTTLDNGLHLLAEPVASAESLAMCLLIPAGTASEPVGSQGLATMLSELIERGAGGKTSREHSEALDLLGVNRGVSVGRDHLPLTATMIGDKLEEAFPLLMDIVRRPMFAEEEFEPSLDLALQAIDALADEPQERVMLSLGRFHNPAPFNRSRYGQADDLKSLTLDAIKAHWAKTFVPSGSVLSFAGAFDWNQLTDQVEQLLGNWQGSRDEVEPTADAEGGEHHETDETEQVHIALAYDAPPATSNEAVLQRMGAFVLSGGMSGRLFTEVREKRGLCYAVNASYQGGKHRGNMVAYAGTTTPRAQETLDVMVDELRKVAEGVTEDEFERAKVLMKSRLVMQGESTSARASAIAADQFTYGKPRTLDERAAEVDGVTLDKLNAYLKANAPGEMTLVTIGPKALVMPKA